MLHRKSVTCVGDMDMEWKEFGIKGKLVTTGKKVLKVLRLMHGLGEKDHDFSLPTPIPTVAPYEPINLLTNYSLEVDLKKAWALENWRKWLNQPK